MRVGRWTERPTARQATPATIHDARGKYQTIAVLRVRRLYCRRPSASDLSPAVPRVTDYAVDILGNHVPIDYWAAPRIRRHAVGEVDATEGDRTPENYTKEHTHLALQRLRRATVGTCGPSRTSTLTGKHGYFRAKTIGREDPNANAQKAIRDQPHLRVIIWDCPSLARAVAGI